MLSLFPSLFTYEQLGPFIIRLTLGLTFAYFGYKQIKGRNREQISGTSPTAYGIAEIIIAILLIIGLYAQLAALIVAIILAVKLAYKIKDKKFLSDGINYYLLLLAMALSLLVTGAGLPAFDLPL